MNKAQIIQKGRKEGQQRTQSMKNSNTEESEVLIKEMGNR